MTQSILEGVTRRAEHLRALTDPSRGEPPSPAFLLDVTEGLRSCVLLRDYLRQSYLLFWNDLENGRLEDSEMAGRIFLLSLSVARKTYEAVRQRAKVAGGGGAIPDVASSFEEALAAFSQAAGDVETLEQNFLASWPWLDEEKFQWSVAAERQGVRRRSLKEVHDDLRSRVR